MKAMTMVVLMAAFSSVLCLYLIGLAHNTSDVVQILKTAGTIIFGVDLIFSSIWLIR